MTDINFNPAFKAREIAAERQRFKATTLGFVMVKTAPWSGRPSDFGTVGVKDIQDGFPTVAKMDGTFEEFPDLDAMLEVWIAD